LNSIHCLGFGESQQRDFDSLSLPGALPGRVAAVDRGTLIVLGATAPSRDDRNVGTASPSGGRAVGTAPRGEGPGLADSLSPIVVPHRSATGIDAPVVGDWVVLVPSGEGYGLASILPRTSLFVRKEAGRGSGAQPVAANVDRVLVVTAVGEDLSPGRIERYVTAIFAGGSRPIIVVNKADRPHDTQEVFSMVTSAAPGVDVAFVNALSEGGLDPLLALISPPMTVALVGSSGVGKTTILNRLLGAGGTETTSEQRPPAAFGATSGLGSSVEARPTREVRASDDTGRHTTTRRELTLVPSGLIVIDTPGVREIGLFDASSGLAAAFPDVVELAASCRFTDCAHGVEPGCALRAAIEQGTLPASRLARYERLAHEIALNDARAGARRSHDDKQRWKSIHKQARQRHKLEKRLGFKGAPPSDR